MNESVTGLTLALSNEDGNAFAIIGRARKLMRENGFVDRIQEFRSEAMAGSYDDLLVTCQKWFNCE